MQLMKQRGSFAKFRHQTKEKRKLYEYESNHNSDVYAANIAQHIIYSYQNSVHEDYHQEEDYQSVTVDKPIEDSNDLNFENYFNENAIN